MPRRWRKRVDYARQRFACVTWRQPRGPAVCRKCRLRAREQIDSDGHIICVKKGVFGLSLLTRAQATKSTFRGEEWLQTLGDHALAD